MNIPQEVIDTVLAEAGGEGPEGIAAVAAVIANRARYGNQSLSDVVSQRNQFEGYGRRPPKGTNRHRQLVVDTLSGLMDGTIADPTNGATHFHSDAVNPAWSSKLKRKGRVGGHNFYRDDKLRWPGSRPSKAVAVSSKQAAAGRKSAKGGKASSFSLASMPIAGDDNIVMSEFGWRTHPVTGKRAFHRGFDIAGSRSGMFGKDILAAQDGEVVAVGKMGNAGNTVIIEHEGGWRTQYLHNDSIRVKKGDKVRAGQHIAEMGSTGRSTGAHLDFMVRDPSGKEVDPLPLIQEVAAINEGAGRGGRDVLRPNGPQELPLARAATAPNADTRLAFDPTPINPVLAPDPEPRIANPVLAAADLADPTAGPRIAYEPQIDAPIAAPSGPRPLPDGLVQELQQAGIRDASAPTPAPMTRPQAPMANPVLALTTEAPDEPMLPPDPVAGTPDALRQAMPQRAAATTPEPRGDFARARSRFDGAKFDPQTFAPTQEGRSSAPTGRPGMAGSPEVGGRMPERFRDDFLGLEGGPLPAPSTEDKMRGITIEMGTEPQEAPISGGRGSDQLVGPRRRDSLGAPDVSASTGRDQIGAPVDSDRLRPTSGQVGDDRLPGMTTRDPLPTPVTSETGTFEPIPNGPFTRADVRVIRPAEPAPQTATAPAPRGTEFPNPVFAPAAAPRVANPVLDAEVLPPIPSNDPERMGSAINRQPMPGDFWTPNIPDYVDSSDWKWDPRNPTRTPGKGASAGYRRAHEGWLAAGGDPDIEARQRGERGGGFFSGLADVLGLDNGFDGARRTGNRVFDDWDRDRTKATVRGALMGSPLGLPGIVMGGVGGAVVDTFAGGGGERRGSGFGARLGAMFDGDDDTSWSNPTGGAQKGKSKSKRKDKSSGSSRYDNEEKYGG